MRDNVHIDVVLVDLEHGDLVEQQHGDDHFHDFSHLVHH